ncbi:hypothetical protein SAMN05444280_108125 [Tangfeifania diversioriginum]|uniref:Uncharacterized protein n=1 Tax=Tangfeifania diversioriginum TaxID=1168035 RepID=A0A1M6FD95_9BACT|nr:hypothetical protein [Tangfeifania diversioriginum]SHI95625.1 hypothetical protein SAMN05444280_108125 [Tangfeifania diversioriginum]
MNKENFTPQLIGRNYEAIEKETDNWQYAVQQLNSIAREWQNQFAEFDVPFTPDRVNEILVAKDIGYLLKSIFIENEPELAKLATSNRIKRTKLIEITDFPDFDSLKNEIISFKIWVDRTRMEGRLNQIDTIYQDGKFVFPDEMKKSIEENHTWYTRDETENAALKIVQDVCSAFNRYNELGGDVNSRDLPRPFGDYITTVKGDKTFGELNSGASESRYFVPKLIPHWGMFKSDKNTLLNLVSANYFID